MIKTAAGAITAILHRNDATEEKVALAMQGAHVDESA